MSFTFWSAAIILPGVTLTSHQWWRCRRGWPSCSSASRRPEIAFSAFWPGASLSGLTGLLAWQLGGRRPAQILAMTGVLAAPVFLGTSNYLSMNSFEPCFWMGSLLVVMRLADGSANPRAWLLFGLLAGLGIENKHSTVFFLVALLAGLLAEPAAPHPLVPRLRWRRGSPHPRRPAQLHLAVGSSLSHV